MWHGIRVNISRKSTRRRRRPRRMTPSTDVSGARYAGREVCRPHSNTGVVRARFKSNLPPKSMGAKVHAMIYPIRI
ncbi:hypothetical protein CBR_g30263 [Chara braunii]|uniref:Uncharacterized protein n=1 Tax=Chara braunii TaxID=69332 RepID=A0A388LCU2_CHABU|nr:hypothetical protein CBR_g30263 [Chara braunii]|eukprot:GBG80002.1 hypothetical protein CBR_g30263 [Chara braunii]